MDALWCSRRFSEIVFVGVLAVVGLNFSYGLPVSPTAQKRMVKPPTFPYDPPYGYTSSGILCLFGGFPYLGDWVGRSCAGPIPPFIIPTPPSTTTEKSDTASAAASSLSVAVAAYRPPTNYPSFAHNPFLYADYGDPVEGNPWEPDDDDIFIENYGVPASRPGFKLGDPNRAG